MKGYVERMIEESRQLDERIEKLGLFINSNTKFQALDEKNKQLLREQYKAMTAYANILNERIKINGGYENG